MNRRGFLRGALAGLGAAGLGLPSIAGAASTMGGLDAYLFTEGDFGEQLHGVAAWLPTEDVTVFFGLDRSPRGATP